MTTLLEQLHFDRMAAFKAGDKEVKDALTTLYAECVAIGKNDGNRDTTDSEVIAVIKKTINNNLFTKEAILDKKELDTDHIADSKVRYLNWENNLFNNYLPKQMTNEEIATEVDCYVSTFISSATREHAASGGPKPASFNPTMKDIMGYFKVKFEGQYDGKNLATITKDKLAGLK